MEAETSKRQRSPSSSDEASDSRPAIKVPAVATAPDTPSASPRSVIGSPEVRLLSPVDGTSYRPSTFSGQVLEQLPPSPPPIFRRGAEQFEFSSTASQAQLAEETRAADGRISTTLLVKSKSAPLPPIANFCRCLFPILKDSVLDDVSLTREGFFKVRTRFPFNVTRAIQHEFPTFAVKIQPPNAKQRDMTFRRVPTDIPLKALQRELAVLLGLDFISVRRLHATTEGQPDPQRPLPVIVVRVNECALPTLKSWRLFDVLNIAPGADREVVAPVQCYRCWAWGHRSGACHARKRCVRCGSHAHDGSQCSQDKDTPCCFACKGSHSVRWGGCPERKKEDERVRIFLDATPSTATPAVRLSVPAPPSNTSTVKPGVSYASRASRATLPTAQAGRFDGLLVEDAEVDLDQSPDNYPTPKESAAECKLRRKREVAYALREKRAALQQTEEDLYKVGLARALNPSQALTKRHRVLNAKLGTLRLRIRELEDERKGLASVPDPPSRPPSRPLSPRPPSSPRPPPSPGRSPRQSASQSVGAPSCSPVASGWSGLWQQCLALVRSLWSQIRQLLSQIPFLSGIVQWVDSLFL